VEILKLDIGTSEADRGKLDIQLTCRVRETNNEFNLVFPFISRREPDEPTGGSKIDARQASDLLRQLRATRHTIPGSGRPGTMRIPALDC